MNCEDFEYTFEDMQLRISYEAELNPADPTVGIATDDISVTIHKIELPIPAHKSSIQTVPASNVDITACFSTRQLLELEDMIAEFEEERYNSALQ